MTKIFSSFNDFLNREDKTLNGVSAGFARQNPNWEADNQGNEGCWNCSDCADCSRCTGCSGCARCSNCTNCFDCSYCTDCTDCSNCSGCTDCFDCSNCSGCTSENDITGTFDVPLVVNIHQRVLECVEEEGAFDMSKWHSCETTHCRAGWVVTLAGDEGKRLEKETSTPFAAMMIYKASSQIDVSPTEFYKNNEEAMEDIRRCAREEAEQQH